MMLAPDGAQIAIRIERSCRWRLAHLTLVLVLPCLYGGANAAIMQHVAEKYRAIAAARHIIFPNHRCPGFEIGLSPAITVVGMPQQNFASLSTAQPSGPTQNE